MKSFQWKFSWWFCLLIAHWQSFWFISCFYQLLSWSRHSQQLYDFSSQDHSFVNDKLTSSLALSYISQSAFLQFLCSLILHSWQIFLNSHVCKSHLLTEILLSLLKLLLSELFLLLILKSHLLSRQYSISLRLKTCKWHLFQSSFRLLRFR